MRQRILAFALVAFGGSAALAAETVDRLVDHVVLVSVDGLRPEFYLDRTWPAPTLQQLTSEGAHAEAVRGVFPSVTYPSHTTMLTGALPSRHGIFYNAPFEPAGQTGRWYWEAAAIRSPTLWQAAREAGLKTASVGWPVSVGAEVDWNVPEVWSLDENENPIDVVRRETRPVGLLEELEREATGRLTRFNFTIDHMTRDDRAGAIAAYLFERYQPHLMTVHLIETDHFQHEDGRESHRVRRAVGAADRALGQIYEAVERAGLLERTAFVVTGDHGHVDLHTRLAPNVWLAAAGLLAPEADRGAWRAAFHTSGTAAFLHLRDPADSAALEQVRQVLAALPAGVRGLFRVLERQELDALGAAPEAALALALVPGVHVTDKAQGPALGPASGASHGYVPDFPHIQTGLVASGAGIRRGAAAAQLRLTDVAALVARLLGLELATPDGALPAGFLTAE